LAVTLAEAAILSGPTSGRPLGATVVLPDLPIRMDAHLFGETQSRIVVTVEEARLMELERRCAEEGVPMTVIGRIGGERLTIRIKGQDRPAIDLSVEAMRTAWDGAIESYFKEREAMSRDVDVR
jgi:phosphoribosylformylglycinamidine synthase